MTETRVIVACAERKVHWYLGAEPAKCTDPGHQHRQFEAHRHRDAVTLPDGTPGHGRVVRRGRPLLA